MRLFDLDKFNEIIEALLRNKSRSILTGFGVFWGIFMLLFMIGGGQGLKTMLAEQLAGFATNSGFIVPSTTTIPYKGFQKGRWWRLTTDDIDMIKRHVTDADVVTGLMTPGSGSTVMYDDKEVNASCQGVFPEYALIDEPVMKYGRFINEIDIQQERKVCVIGKSVYEELFEEGEDPCGKYVKYGDVYYQIVGVNFHKSIISLAGASDGSMTIPLTTLQKIYHRGNRVDFLAFTAKPGIKIKDVIEDIKGILCRQHLISPDDKKAIFDLNAEQMFSIMDNVFKGVNLLIWLVGFGTLLAAAIGVSNIMMVTVKERTTEIGIRRAIGATPRMILSQIMSESIILTIVSGMFGILMAVGGLSVAEIIARQSSEMTEVGFQISFSVAMLALLILIILGVGAGLAPARRAMAIKPVDAMRDE